LNAIEEHAGAHPWHTPGELHATQSNTTVDTRLVFAGGDALVGAAIVTSPPPGGHRVDVTGGVHPGWWGRGIGREHSNGQVGFVEESRAVTYVAF